MTATTNGRAFGAFASHNKRCPLHACDSPLFEPNRCVAYYSTSRYFKMHIKYNIFNVHFEISGSTVIGYTPIWLKELYYSVYKILYLISIGVADIMCDRLKPTYQRFQ